MTDKVQDFKPAAEDLHQRIDLVLKNKLSDTSRSQIKKMIEEGFVRVNNQPIKAGYLIRPNDSISIQIRLPESSGVTAEPIPLSIVYQDEDIAVVDKPAGLAVHPAASVKSGTLVNALLFHFRQLSESADTHRPGIVHRLDKLTSGLLVVAKNNKAHKNLVDQFKARTVRKEYVALVYGRLEKPTGSIEVGIGRDPFDRKKFSSRTRHARTALTRYEVTERLMGFTLLRVKLLTGRTHQIRVHLSTIGHPIVGDQIYGGNRYKEISNMAKRAAVQDLGRFFLHATLLEFTHPVAGGRLTFASQLPAELAHLLSLLR